MPRMEELPPSKRVASLNKEFLSDNPDIESKDIATKNAAMFTFLISKIAKLESNIDELSKK